MGDLVTKKITVHDANSSQISFIVQLLRGYYEIDMNDNKANMGLKQNAFFRNTISTKSNEDKITRYTDNRNQMLNYFKPVRNILDLKNLCLKQMKQIMIWIIK